jgi:8-oxo-dGTP pyrophosphatase MutT (NUDIX family)
MTEEQRQELKRALAGAESALGNPITTAAVLAVLREGPAGLEVLLELRAGNLSRSPGEVGLPGGLVEQGESPLEAALRELEEELGIGREELELLGKLPVQQRRRGELVEPFVALLRGQAAPRPRADEVEAVFSLPLAHLRRHGYRTAHVIEEHSLAPDFPRKRLPPGGWGHREERPVHYFDYRGYFIWGLTARILIQLVRLLPGE